MREACTGWRDEDESWEKHVQVEGRVAEVKVKTEKPESQTG